MEKKKMYTTQTHTGNRTFYFDIKESEQRKPYLVITESRKVNDQLERKSIILFDTDVEKFNEAWGKALLHFTLPSREEMIEEARKKHPKAYEPWSDEDESQLKQLFESNSSMTEMSTALGRNEGAIKARLVKMELIPST